MKIFLRKSTTGYNYKRKILLTKFYKNKIMCYSKDIDKKTERQSTDWEKNIHKTYI